MTSALLVFFGAGIGGVLRHGVNFAAMRWPLVGFPYGTMAINVVGSGLMGLVAGWFAFRAGEGTPQDLRLFLTTGILGGFTTFSAFALDAATIIERGDWGVALGYALVSVVGSVLAVFAGLGIMRAFA